MSTADWLSSAVENTSIRRAGMVVLRSMIFVMSPPIVSTPRDSGVTSRSRTSFISPLIMAAWMAAPMATTSSGLTVMLGSLPPVSRRTSACTAGMRVEPPTRITSSMSSAVDLGVCHGLLHRTEATLDQIGRDLLEARRAGRW